MTLTKSLVAAALIATPATGMAQDWAGPYAGAQLGGSDIQADGTTALDGDGNAFGIFAGYQIARGALTLGAEIDLDSTDYTLPADGSDITATYRIKARAGMPFAGGLAYGTGGIVWMTSPQLGDDSGFLYGMGYDYPLSNSLTLGGELLQHELFAYNGSDIDLSVFTFKARIAFRF